MTRWLLALSLLSCLPGQTILTNSNGNLWKQDPGDLPGHESIILREDAATGAIEFFTRYAAGHVFQPHWHTANERIVLLEGRLEIRAGDHQETIEPAGFAFFPGKQLHQMKCVSTKRCAFYLSWDTKPDFHREAK